MTPRRIVFLFGGQGSQYPRMAADLCARDEVFGSWCRRLDAVAAGVLGESALEAVWRTSTDGRSTCDRLAATHPALFIVQYALYRRLADAGVRPDIVLGASLGETVAAAVSGVLAPEDAVLLLCRQALGVERQCPTGGMLAIVAGPELFQREVRLWRHNVVAAFNHARHFVISGSRTGLDEALAFLAGTDVLHQELPVRYAFHSAGIEAAADSYREAAHGLRLNRRVLDLWSPTYECALETLPEGYFWDVARRPVYFERTVRRLEQTGPHVYVDCSPAGTLDSFMRQILAPNSASLSVATLSPFGEDEQRLDRALERLAATHWPPLVGPASGTRP